MRVRFCAGVTREMFAAARDSLLAHGVVESAGVAHDLLDRFSITAPAQRIVGAIIERKVEHRAKVQIESENPEQSSGDIAVTADKTGIILVTQLLGVWRLASDQAQSRNAAAFLVDRDDWFNRTQSSQVIDQLPQLRRAFDVPPEKNEAARLDAPEHFRTGGVERFSRNAAEYQLTDRTVVHRFGT